MPTPREAVDSFIEKIMEDSEGHITTREAIDMAQVFATMSVADEVAALVAAIESR